VIAAVGVRFYLPTLSVIGFCSVQDEIKKCAVSLVWREEIIIYYLNYLLTFTAYPCVPRLFGGEERSLVRHDVITDQMIKNLLGID
jgi:hypothetical protein